MSAAPTTLARLTAIQRRGLRLIGDGAYLSSLDIRTMVGALCFLYKLHFSTGPDMLEACLGNLATIPKQDTYIKCIQRQNCLPCKCTQMFWPKAGRLDSLCFSPFFHPEQPRHSRRTQWHPSHQLQLTSTLPLRARNDDLRYY